MNYPTFLKEVDRLASECDADALRLFVHETARTVSESGRRRFLSALSSFCGDFAEKESDVAFADQIESHLKALETIKSGDRELDSEYDPEWDDWWGDDGDAYLFSDPDNILGDITEAVRALHQCIDREEYEKGAKLAKALSELSVHVTGDCEDAELGLHGLKVYDLLNYNPEKMMKEALYLVLMGTREAERAEAMLTLMDHFGDYSVSLESILQTGSDEIDLPSLLPSWIEALAKRPERISDKLLVEAQNMLQDKNTALENARRYAESHPVLYREILHTGIANIAPEEMMNIGLRAMEEVPVNHPARSGISLLTAEYALTAKSSLTAEACWMEAFRTSPTVESYLRLRLQSQCWEKYANDVQDIYTAFYESRSAWEQKPLAVLMFFDEQFDKMIHKFMKARNGIGWSSTFMKEGIALLLMLMDSGNTRRQGMTAMLDKAISACSFDSASYCEGTDLDRCIPTADLLQECFQKWKVRITLPENAYESWLNMIDKWISLRVTAIMDANRRNYYGECAAFVAAYGEVLESRGKSGEKDRIMRQYKAAYPRRRTFHNELRKFGMR